MILLAAGLALTLAGWAMTRTVARAWTSRRLAGWALDLAIPLLMFAAFLALTARPLMAGAATFALIGGFAFADWGKRDVLREPVVFSDLSELKELVRHPHLYLPYVGTWKVAGGAALGALAFVALGLLEPPLWPLTALTFALGAAGVAAVVLGTATLWLAPAGRLLGRIAVTGDLVADSAALGGLAMQFAYGVPTRAGRAAARARLSAPAAPLAAAGRTPDIVLVQCESFFDARRLGSTVPAGLLPAYDRLRETGVQWGRLVTPTWGASTTRTEFAVLAGQPAYQLGLDRFNPYHALARQPLTSLASRLRAVGYRTLCVHPYDRTFYGRHKVLPALGFDEFLGLEAFAGAPRRGRYVTDRAAAELTAERIARSAQPMFAFVITMENHGPWPDFDAYLAGLAASDAMIDPLAQALSRRGDGVLGFYGDHMPSLSLGPEAGTATDYAIWQAGSAREARRIDLPAHDLGDALLAAAGLVADAWPAAAE